MKRASYLLFFALMLIFVMTIVSFSVSVFDNSNNEYFTNDENTFLLPSHIKPSSVTIMSDGVRAQVDLTSNKEKDSLGNTIYKYNLENAEYIFYFADNLPSIYVTTSISLDQLLAPENTRKTDKSAKLFIVDKDGNIEYADSDSTYGQIKVRGNSTDDYDKQPFQIKLDKKHNLFGMGEAKTWILLANYLDQSLIRNSVMYKIGELLGMDTCQFRSVDLYLNGEYYGVYMLCEKVQIHPQRVDIYDLEAETELLNPDNYGFTQRKTKGTLIDETIITEYQYVKYMENPADISGGYLVELDNNYYKGEKCYFKTSNGNAYVIKSPEYASQEQVEYIARVFAEMEEAIYSPTGKNSKGLHYSQYADVESLAYAYIMQELGRNWDSGSSSMYFYKDRDVNGKFTKIVKGPLWDCDNTLGNMLKGDANNPEGYWAKNRKLWVGLTQHEYFNYIVAKEFLRVCPEIIKMTEENGYISQLVRELGSSVAMERLRWGTGDYSKWPFYSYRLYPQGVHYDSWQGWKMTFNFNEIYSDGVDNTDQTAIGYLKDHINKRANWLLEEYAYSESIETPSISSDGKIDDTLQMPVAPTFTPTYPESTDKDSSITTDTSADSIVDTSTDTPTDNTNSDDESYDIILIIVIVVICVAVVTTIIVLVKLKRK